MGSYFCVSPKTLSLIITGVILVAGLLSECHRKNIMAIAESTVGCDYVNSHQFLHNAPWGK
jgi:hypothetical protein